MEPSTGLVQPIQPQQPQQPVAPPEETQTATASPPQQKLPPALIKMPVMQALMAGAPPAVSASIKEFSKKDEAEHFVKNKAVLEQAGFGFYRSLSGHLGVIFNALHIHPADLQAADKAGKLQLLAPPFDVVNHAVSKSGMHNPVLKRAAVPNGLAQPTQAAPPQLSASVPPGQTPTPMKPPSAGVQNKFATARLAALQPGAPTSGPEPGAGRLLNQILRPVV